MTEFDPLIWAEGTAAERLVCARLISLVFPADPVTLG